MFSVEEDRNRWVVWADGEPLIAFARQSEAVRYARFASGWTDPMVRMGSERELPSSLAQASAHQSVGAPRLPADLPGGEISTGERMAADICARLTELFSARSAFDRVQNALASSWDAGSCTVPNAG